MSVKKSKLDEIREKALKQSQKNISQADMNGTNIPVNDIKVNPYQPRKFFDEDKIKSLSESIKKNGLLQPITVAQINNEYILIAGERRLKAHKLASYNEIKCQILYDIDDKKLKELSLIENMQRDNLSIMEEAISYKTLIDEYNMSYRDLEELTSRKKSAIGNIVALTAFSEECKNILLKSNIKSTKILNYILKCDESMHFELINRLLDENLSLKELEAILKRNDVKEDKKTNIQNDTSYPYGLPEIYGVGITKKSNKLKIEIDTKIFLGKDIDNIKRYLNNIIEKMQNGE